MIPSSKLGDVILHIMLMIEPHIGVDLFYAD